MGQLHPAPAGAAGVVRGNSSGNHLRGTARPRLGGLTCLGRGWAGEAVAVAAYLPHSLLEQTPSLAYVPKTSGGLLDQSRRAVTVVSVDAAGLQAYGHSVPSQSCIATGLRLTHVSQGPETRLPVRKALFRALLSHLHPGRSGTREAGPGDTRREPKYPVGPTTGKGVELCLECRE